MANALGPIEALIAAVTARHLFTLYPDALACDCDWTTHEGSDQQRIAAWVRHHAAEVAAALAERTEDEREAMLREFESLADFWTLSRGWVGPVALHDFRRKIDAFREVAR